MLTKTIDTSINNIETYSQAKKNQMSATKFKLNINKLSQVVENLNSCIGIVEEILNQKLVQESLISASLQASLLESIDNCGSQIEQISLTQESIGQLETKSQLLQEKIAHSWQKIYVEHSKGLASYLGLIENLVNDTTKARSLKNQLNNYAQTVPRSQNDIKEFVKAIAEAQVLVDQLKVDDRIRDFLIKVVQKRATLVDLDKYIFEWFEKNKLAEKIKISF